MTQHLSSSIACMLQVTACFKKLDLASIYQKTTLKQQRSFCDIKNETLMK